MIFTAMRLPSGDPRGFKYWAGMAGRTCILPEASINRTERSGLRFPECANGRVALDRTLIFEFPGSRFPTTKEKPASAAMFQCGAETSNFRCRSRVPEEVVAGSCPVDACEGPQRSPRILSTWEEYRKPETTQERNSEATRDGNR